MNGRDGTTTFLPLNIKISGQVNNNRPNVGQFLTREQTKYISGKIINTETMQQELEQERQLDRIDDANGEIIQTKNSL